MAEVHEAWVSAWHSPKRVMNVDEAEDLARLARELRSISPSSRAGGQPRGFRPPRPERRGS